MNDRRPVEGITAAEPAAHPRVAERVVSEARTRQAREEREPEPPPLPIEPSPAHRPYRVQLDPETSRLFTEVLDPKTGGVLLRIPPGYSPSEAAQEPEVRPAALREMKL